MQRFDFLVIGGGIAGLSYAIEVAEKGRSLFFSKKALKNLRLPGRRAELLLFPLLTMILIFISKIQLQQVSDW